MKVVVSLTTIFDRQKQCVKTLKSLLQQTRKPDEIRLYVSSDSFLLDKGIQLYCLEPSLYEVVNSQKQIHVEWVKNTGPYRKLLPALKTYWQQDILIITCDDDVEYKTTFIETAVKLYDEKQCCIAFQGTRMNNSFDYASFEDAKDTQHLWNLPKGVGGIVYNPKWFSNPGIFELNLHWKNDDLWFVAWRIASGVDCYVTKEGSVQNSFATKTNLWTSYNYADNSAYLEEILHLLSYKGCIQGNDSFFSETSHTLFQWNRYLQEKLLVHVGQEDLEGNIWSRNHTIEPESTLLNKQKNIVWLAKELKEGTVLEVGLNAGFSALLFLLSNPTIKLIGYDLGEHEYAKRCVETLQSDFPGRLEVVFGDSRKTLPLLPSKSFECIHIDGGHSEEVAKSDVKEASRLLKSNGFLLVDDTNLGDVRKAIQAIPELKEVLIPYKTSGYTHGLYTLN
jgi:predicted O-methyltransferase YrrM